MGADEQSGYGDRSDAEVALGTIPLHSTNLLTVLDSDGEIRYESPAIERIYGYDPDELVGEQVAEYFHPDDRDRVRDAFRTVVSNTGDAVESVEYRHERADGSYVWVESVASAEPTPEGYYVVNTRDISARKTRERELEATNERLGTFAEVVSHDLRNPLNVAAGRLQLFREDPDSDHLDAVERAHERMVTLVDDLLTLAQSGRDIDATEWVDIAALAADCWRTVSTADASLVTDIDRDVRADRSRMRQLLENIVGNAVEHGGDDVTVVVGELPGGNGFYVADDGPGIPKTERGAVFETGFSTGGDGTGLGLAIVSEIADAHGWHVAVTASKDGGARFEITGVETR